VLSSMAATNPRWLAPEILGGRGYTFSSDIYSFGIILWEFLTWRVPWWDCGPWQVVAMVTESHQRPDIANRALWATPPFEGIQDYLDLMQTCWAQARLLPTPLPGSPLPQPAPGSSRPATSFLSPLCGRARRWHGTACRPRQGPRPGAQPPCKQRRRKHARRLAHAAPGAAQEATQRPTFGEIIPVLRRLLAEETRRQARRPSAGAAAAASEAAPRPLAPSAAAGGSGDLAGARGPQVPASLRAPACPMCRLHFHAGTWPGAHARYQRVRRLPRRSGSGPIGASTSGGSVWLRQPWACASAVPVAVMRPLASRPQLRRREWSVCIVPRR